MRKRKKTGGMKDVKKKKTRGSREREVMNCGGKRKRKRSREEANRGSLLL